MVSQTLTLLIFLTMVNLPFDHGEIVPSTSHVSVSRELLEDQGVRAAYWNSFGEYAASSIDTSYFSHVYYAFVQVSPTTFALDITSADVEKLLEFTNAASRWNPPAKTLLSLGGGGGDKISSTFSQMASDQYSRASFINSTIKVARQYKFDGIDLDWEYPSNDVDMSNLGLLFKEWREATENEASVTGSARLVLTSAVYYSSTVLYNGGPQPRLYPIEAITQYVDWISPMCYDYHGSWESVTGLHTALYDPNTNLNTDFGIGSWIQSGVPAEKIVLGLALYGPTWSLQDPNVNTVGAPTTETGPGSGTLVYNQVIDFNQKNSATVVFDDKRVGYYSYSGISWVSYDDVQSIEMKVRYARSRALGGYFFWALGQDSNWAISSAASKTWLN